jgi:hypothetical protein
VSAPWVAGGVRAKAASSRRLGSAGARALARVGGLDLALARLTDGPYGHDVRAGQTVVEAQHAVAATLLWHLRVLAGWLPRQGVEAVRLLAGWAELANIEALQRSLRAASSKASPGDAPPPVPPFALGSLASGWPRAREARDATSLRRALATTVWGDPGADDERTSVEVLRLTWAARVAGSVAPAERWARGAAALVVAHDLAERAAVAAPTASPATRAAIARALGPDAAAANTVDQLRAALDARSRWALGDAHHLEDLPTCEFAWWHRVERDAAVLTATSTFDLAPVVGVVALLAVDAWRTRAALAVAAHGTGPEVLDGLI